MWHKGPSERISAGSDQRMGRGSDLCIGFGDALPARPYGRGNALLATDVAALLAGISGVPRFLCSLLVHDEQGQSERNEHAWGLAGNARAAGDALADCCRSSPAESHSIQSPSFAAHALLDDGLGGRAYRGAYRAQPEVGLLLAEAGGVNSGIDDHARNPNRNRHRASMRDFTCDHRLTIVNRASVEHS
jgi:hypothetical protein